MENLESERSLPNEPTNEEINKELSERAADLKKRSNDLRERMNETSAATQKLLHKNDGSDQKEQTAE
ncbi:hypothetical protein [uncultured Chitinophaga sp.]|uniref:hypothetical protein n=1 Tax=uncultured Chitinophaga sp. TaxID=339340 RepID=UPI00261D91F5|nr:hypothetical protein [uncultured Chitinophaga sp.]